MNWLEWLRPPRQLLTFSLAGMLAAVAALAVLTWRLLDQERQLTLQRADERLELAADLSVTGFQRRLGQLERLFIEQDAPLPTDAVILVVQRGQVQARPAGSLLFSSFESTVAAPSLVFRAAEASEFGAGGFEQAIPLYRDLAQSATPTVRAGALMRLGRCLRKAGRPDEALEVYERLQKLGGTPVEGLPAEVAALEAICTTLAELNRRGPLASRARELYGCLAGGRWPLPLERWEFCLQEVREWSGLALAPVPEPEAAVARSKAAASLWRRRETLAPAGSAVEVVEGLPVLTLWRSTAERLAAVLAGREYLESIRREVAAESRVRLSLATLDGQPLLGEEGTPQVLRAAAATRLPWDFGFSDADPAAPVDEAAARKRTLLSGLAVLGALILGSGYLTLRGIRRELELGRLQSEFVSAVSHEFRTPLTSIRQLSDMLVKDRVPGEERRRQYYEVLAHESLRLHRLVERLLSFGRAEAGTGGYRSESLDLCELVRTATGEFERQSTGFRVELSLPAQPVPLGADREMLSMALWNLLDNASKYSPECRTAWVTLSRNGSAAELAVRDQGMGIPREERHSIFRKFVRGARAVSAGVKGAGIGLALVDHVARAHGGEVRLKSEVGRGSIFTLVLPLSEPPG